MFRRAALSSPRADGLNVGWYQLLVCGIRLGRQLNQRMQRNLGGY